MHAGHSRCGNTCATMLTPVTTLLRQAHALRVRAQPAVARAASRCCSGGRADNNDTSAPVVSTVSTDEHRAGVRASALRPHETGASVEAMQRFWLNTGLSYEASSTLADRAVLDGGVWSDPLALEVRVSELRRLLPSANIQQLLGSFPAALEQRPTALRDVLQTLSAALPGQDAVRMVELEPHLLGDEPATLASRARALLPLIPRPDLPALVAEHPRLLQIEHKEVAERIGLLVGSYGQRSLMRMPRARLAELMHQPQLVLRRLSYLDQCYPGTRIAVPDRKLLNMRQLAFEQQFRQRSRPKRYRHPVAAPRRALELSAPVPPTANVFEFGAQLREAQAFAPAKQQPSATVRPHDPRARAAGKRTRRKHLPTPRGTAHEAAMPDLPGRTLSLKDPAVRTVAEARRLEQDSARRRERRSRRALGAGSSAPAIET